MIELHVFGLRIKTLGSLGKIRVGLVTGNTHIFFFGLTEETFDRCASSSDCIVMIFVVVVVVNQFWHFIAAYELFVLFFSSVLNSWVPGLLGPKPFRPGTPRPKSIFLLGLLGPVIKILYLWHTMENKCISSVFLFQY